MTVPRPGKKCTPHPDISNGLQHCWALRPSGIRTIPTNDRNSNMTVLMKAPEGMLYV